MALVISLSKTLKFLKFVNDLCNMCISQYSMTFQDDKAFALSTLWDSSMTLVLSFSSFILFLYFVCHRWGEIFRQESSNRYVETNIHNQSCHRNRNEV
jgi:hypothetical protein